MIPLRDDNPTVLWPIVVVTLIAANTAVFFYELSLEPRALETFILRAGMVPSSILQAHVSGTGGYFTALALIPLFRKDPRRTRVRYH